MSTETSNKNITSEEDTKILENYLKNSAYKQSDSDFFKNGGWEIVDLRIPQAIEHILSEREQDKKRIQELEEENKILLNSKIGIDLSYDDYISKQKIKDKIEDLRYNNKLGFEESLEEFFKIEVLEELLEEE